MLIISNAADLQLPLNDLKELGLKLFVFVSTALVLIGILIAEFYHVLKIYAREKHDYEALKKYLLRDASIVAASFPLDLTKQGQPDAAAGSNTTVAEQLKKTG